MLGAYNVHNKSIQLTTSSVIKACPVQCLQLISSWPSKGSGQKNVLPVYKSADIS